MFNRFQIVASFCLLTICSLNVACTGNASKDRIENGLIEFKSPAAMFNPDSTQLANPKPLEERMAHYNTPGVSIAVIDNFELAWSAVYGIMDQNSAMLVTYETIFEAASTSKFITAVIALHFVEQGQIDLDTDVNRYLKSWQVPENDYTKDEKVTLRRLLTHQAGLPTTNYSYDDAAGYPTLQNVLRGESPAQNKPATPELVPGTQWQYSNVAYNVIEQLLEDVSARTFADLAAELIFEPLGMTNSSFSYPLTPEKKQREAMPHDAEGIRREPAMHLTALAHGGLTTTPSDLAIFTREIMQSYRGQSQRLISRQTARQLFTRQVDLDPRIFGLPIAEGLGVFLTGEGEDLVFTHPGSNLPGLNCWLIGWPERGTGIVVMTNGASGEMLAMEIITAFIHEYN